MMLEPIFPPLKLGCRTTSFPEEYDKKFDGECDLPVGRRIRWGGLSRKGPWREHNEDRSIVEIHEGGDVICCIFDGHGGKQVSQYCKENWVHVLTKHPLYASNLREALRQTFFQIDLELFQLGLNGGSTATCVVVRKNMLYVAYVGDSGVIAVTCEKGEGKYGYTELTKDDKPGDENEQERILRSGLSVYVDPSGMIRVVSYDKKKSLAVSRTLGNFDFKGDLLHHPENQGVTCVPHVSQHALIEPVYNILVASDGIWEVASPREVACMLKQNMLLHDASPISTVLDKIATRCIATNANDLYGKDNITCILLKITT